MTYTTLSTNVITLARASTTERYFRNFRIAVLANSAIQHKQCTISQKHKMCYIRINEQMICFYKDVCYMLKTLTINAITQYIEDNLEIMPIDINNLIDYSGYSRRYLQLLFKNNIGIPVGRYIQLRRITRAAILLRLTSFNLSAIAERLHYDSQQTSTGWLMPAPHSSFTRLPWFTRL